MAACDFNFKHEALVKKRDKNYVSFFSEELMDCCDGHTTPGDGVYHHHDLPIANKLCDDPAYDSSNTAIPQFMGISLDGFPIFRYKTNVISIIYLMKVMFNV